MTINLDQALKIIEATKDKAKEIGVPMVIAVVDAGGNLVAEQRMDEALLVSVDLAHNKAYTSVAMKMSTGDLAGVTQPGQMLFGLHNADGGRIVIFGGCIPLRKGDQVVGGIGVSGGSVEADIQCAEAGVSRFQSLC